MPIAKPNHWIEAAPLGRLDPRRLSLVTGLPPEVAPGRERPR